ncbi:MAG: hypothetical protein AB7J32_09990, partial [Pseudonocardia sp.]
LSVLGLSVLGLSVLLSVRGMPVPGPLRGLPVLRSVGRPAVRLLRRVPPPVRALRPPGTTRT